MSRSFIDGSVMTVTDLLMCWDCLLPAGVAAGMSYTGIDVQVANLVDGVVAPGPMNRAATAAAVVYASTAIGKWFQMRMMQA